MAHEESLIATIAVSLAFAFVGGWLAARLRLPPLLGYLMAGIVVGPFTPGFVADAKLVPQLAELGVILLMFGVGMHFSVKDLLAVKGIAVPGAIAQIAVTTALGAGVAHLWGWSLGAGLVFGLALSVASTVVLLRALEEYGTLNSPDGRIAVGWLVVEDLAMVLTLVLLPAFAPQLGGQVPVEHGAAAASGGGIASGGVWITLGLTLGKVVLFVALMLVVGARVFPWLLKRVERTGSRELFTLAVIALSLGVAFGAAHLFGVSFALGAFFAGVVINESELSHRAAENLQPLQDVFAALFFVGMGMLFDPAILRHRPLELVAVVAIIVLGKSLAAIGIVLVLRRGMNTALTVSAALAQIGEFSFILAAMGLDLGLIDTEAQHLIVGGAILSIALNPLAFLLASRLQRPPVTAAARSAAPS